MNYYIAAYVDLLGQREALKEVKPLFPQNAQEGEELRKAAGEAIRVVLNLHGIFSKYLEGSSVQKTSPSLSPEQEKLHTEMTTSTMRSQSFSDGLVFFVSLRDGVPAAGVSHLLHACGSLCLWQLGVENPVRIGVDLHFGVVLDECGFYGPALANAYELESKIAQYPRVVVGDMVMKYLQDIASQNPQDEKGTFSRNICGGCLEMIAQDFDGHHIVDYLGPGFRRYGADNLSKADLLPAYEYVKRKAESYRTAQHKNAENTKRALRYSILLNYFEKRLPLWDAPLEKGDGCAPPL